MAPSSSAQTVQTVVLSQKGEVKQVKLSCKGVSVADIKKAIKSKTDVELLGSYEFPPLTIYMFGAIDGKQGTENEHELPPPHDNILAFGDIVMIASQNKDYSVPEPFTPANYEKFYQYIFEGDDEDEEEDADEEEEVEEEAEEDEEKEEEVEEPEEEVELPEEEIIKPITRKKAAAGAKPRQNLIMSLPDFKELDESSNEDPKHIRKLIRNIIHKTISDVDMYPLENAIFKATLVECDNNHVVAHWQNPLFDTCYMTVARKVIGNLSEKSYVQNTRLHARLKESEFTYDELATKNYYDLFPEAWKELSDRQIVREARLLEGNKGMATDQFKCHGCGKRECTYYEMQTRSADEPMTIFITCLNCGKRWRQ